MKKIKGKIRRLILKCNKDIEGYIDKEELIELLPIQEENLKIFEENNAIHIMINGQLRKRIYSLYGCYSNLDILKSIIPDLYGINLKSEQLLELMKFKYKIDNIVL